MKGVNPVVPPYVAKSDPTKTLGTMPFVRPRPVVPVNSILLLVPRLLTALRSKEEPVFARFNALKVRLFEPAPDISREVVAPNRFKVPRVTFDALPVNWSAPA